jgi:hypothetical protein
MRSSPSQTRWQPGAARSATPDAASRRTSPCRLRRRPLAAHTQPGLTTVRQPVDERRGDCGSAPAPRRLQDEAEPHHLRRLSWCETRPR